MHVCCPHETTFGLYACCKRVRREGKESIPCRKVQWHPSGLEEKTHGYSQSRQAEMEKSATLCIQLLGHPLIAAMIHRLVPFPLIDLRKEADKPQPSLIVHPGNSN